MARPELPSAAAPYSAVCFSISVGGSHPLFQPPAKNALLFFVWLWYIGLGIVKAALKSSIFLFFLEQLCYFNLSPQGDGNTQVICKFLKVTNFNLSPQGDGNSASSSAISLLWHFNLSPQGDGNDTAGLVKANELHFNLSPQGDGNETSLCPVCF